MKQTNRHPKILISKIYYLKERNKSCPGPHLPKRNPLTVHLSSALQSDRRQALNKEMETFVRKLSSPPASAFFLLTERPQTEQISNRIVHSKRSVHTSHEAKHRKKQDPTAFYLSQIADETANCNQILQIQAKIQDGQRSKSGKKNYRLRRNEFKTFLREREEKMAKKQTIQEQAKQVVYQKYEFNSWEIDFKLDAHLHPKSHPQQYRTANELENGAKRKVSDGGRCMNPFGVK